MIDEPTGQERQVAALDEYRRPEEARLTHQAVRWRNRGLFPLCRKCILREKCEVYDSADDDRTCPIAQEAYTDLVAAINSLPQIKPEDMPVVIEYARQVIFVQLIDIWIGEIGPFLPGKRKGTLEPQPVLTGLRYTAAGHIARLSDRLGLNPAARAKLKEAGHVPPLAARVLRIEEEENDSGQDTAVAK